MNFSYKPLFSPAFLLFFLHKFFTKSKCAGETPRRTDLFSYFFHLLHSEFLHELFHALVAEINGQHGIAAHGLDLLH